METKDDIWKLYEIEDRLGRVPRVFEQTPIDITHTLLFGEVLDKKDRRQLFQLLRRANLSVEYLIRITEGLLQENHPKGCKQFSFLIQEIEYLLDDETRDEPAVHLSKDKRIAMATFVEHFGMTLQNLKKYSFLWSYTEFPGDFEKSPNKGRKHRERGKLFQETLREREEAILEHIMTNDSILAEYLEYMFAKCGIVDRELHHIGSLARSYIVLCPLHQEKTPSCLISRTKNIIKCFGCGKSGSLITFFVKNFDCTRSQVLRWGWQWLQEQSEE